jgi:hypothetical protein
MDGRATSIITTQRKAITAASQRQPTGYAPEADALSWRCAWAISNAGGFPITVAAKSSARLRPAAPSEQTSWWRRRSRPRPARRAVMVRALRLQAGHDPNSINPRRIASGGFAV